MKTKKVIALLILFCLSHTGCAGTQTASGSSALPAETTVPANTVQTEAVQRILPLPDTAMENMTDAVLSVSFNEGDAYVDDNGRMQMDLKIYTYDRYDMVDIANLKVGDTLVRYSGDVSVLSIERNEHGTIYINGGLDNGGFDLVTDDCGTFFEMGYSDTKSWYPVGEATIRVSVDFEGIDRADPDQGEVILYPGDFLIGAVTNYDFTPYNTTVRVENGQIVELTRAYTP